MYSDKKNFLIVTASIGSGHNRAAEAIAKEVKIKYPRAQVHIVDFMSTKTAYLNGFLKEAYLKMLNLVPDVYEFLYSFTAGKVRGFSIQGLMALAMKNDMEALIARHRADVVICTHPFPCAAAAYLKRTRQISVLLAGVITDFAVHQFWVYGDVDLYFVGDAKISKELERRGICPWKIHATGIPIDASFRRKYERQALLEKFSLRPDLPVLLIMGGGLGMGGVKITLTHLEQIEQTLQILVVAGENTALWADIKKWTASSRHRIHVWGFYHQVHELMAAADLLISKPGALTISEALAMELPMVLNEPIPGQEKENAAYVEKTGAAVWVKSSESIVAVVKDILAHPDKLTAMREQAKAYKRPEAAREIVDCIAGRSAETCGGNVAGM